jgi:hypothetical protein
MALEATLPARSTFGVVGVVRLDMDVRQQERERAQDREREAEFEPARHPLIPPKNQPHQKRPKRRHAHVG